jgi:hypothetical protein
MFQEGKRAMVERVLVTVVLTVCYLIALVFTWLPR